MASNDSAGQQTIKLTDQDIERRKRFVGLEADDIPRITAVKALMVQRADELTTSFFDFLSHLDEAAPLFRNVQALEMAKRMKREHLIAMASGVYDRSYVDQRLALGFIYSRAGIDTRVFLGAFHHLMMGIGATIMADAGKDLLGAFEKFMSVKKIGFFDIGLIVDIMVAERERTISAQQEAIRELSTPALQLREHLLILPIIGVVDSIRARQLTDTLLQSIRINRAKMVVMDITGVAAVDSKVANHLIQTIAAARLMGARVIVTGLSANVAQSLVSLGIDLGSVETVGDLQGGLELAERNLGYKLVRSLDANVETA
jgi:rsbT co-antagonist protein RsbR